MRASFYTKNGAFKRGEVRITPSVDYDSGYVQGADSNLVKDNVFTIGEGSRFYDILPFLDAANFAISRKVKNLLEENSVSGWSCFPILIRGAEDKEYFVFQIVSAKAGPITNLEALNNYEEDLTKFDPNTWDGSDIFTLLETGITACVERVKTIFEKAQITNIEFRPLLPLDYVSTPPLYRNLQGENTILYARIDAFGDNEIRFKPIADYNRNSVQDLSSSLVKNNFFTVGEGSAFYDVLPFTDTANFAISKKTKEVLEKHSITGWGCFPIIIASWEDKEYFGFQILSKRPGPILNSAALKRHKEEYIKFDTAEWDGADIFTLENTGMTICTEKVKQILEDAGITNIKFKYL